MSTPGSVYTGSVNPARWKSMDCSNARVDCGWLEAWGEDEDSLDLCLGLSMNEYGRKNIHAVAVRAFAVSSSTPRAFGSGEPIAQRGLGLERDGSISLVQLQ